MSALRSAVRATLNSPRLLALATVVALGETALRISLGLLGPPVLAVLWPPVVAVVGFGLAVPTVRAALPDDERPVPNRDDPGPSTLVAAAVLGHAAAILLGTAGFLLLDTPIRVVLYRFGHGDVLGIPVQVGGATLGVVVGTLLAWVVPGVAIGRLVAGDRVTAVESVLAATGESPRAVAGALGAHLAFAGLLALAVVTAAGVARSTRSGLLPLAVGGGLAALVSAFALALLAARYVGGGVGPVARPEPRRLALVALLLTGLVAGAGGVRLAELRPTDDPAALPDDPDAAYETALANTFRADHRYRLTILDGDDPDGEPFVVDRRLDRTDRQYRQRALGEAQGPDLFAGTGTGSPPARAFDRVALGRWTVGDDRTVRASPDYLYWVDGYRWDDEGGFQPPASVDGWRVVDRSDGRLVLELVGARATFEAVQSVTPDRITNVSAARIRAVIDRERRTLDRIDVRFAATVTVGETTDRIELRVDHEFAVGIDVARPAALGPPGPGELVWKLLVY